MTRTTGRPDTVALPVAHFRALIDGEEIGLLAISSPHALVDDKADQGVRQRVTLTRAATGDARLFNWYSATTQGKRGAERDLTIVQLDAPKGAVVNVWRLCRATPVRWSGPAFDALASAVALEELEVRYASIERSDTI